MQRTWRSKTRKSLSPWLVDTKTQVSFLSDFLCVGNPACASIDQIVRANLRSVQDRIEICTLQIVGWHPKKSIREVGLPKIIDDVTTPQESTIKAILSAHLCTSVTIPRLLFSDVLRVTV